MEQSNSNEDSEQALHHQKHLGNRQRGLPNDDVTGRLLKKGNSK